MCICLRVRTWLACVIGVKSISPVVGWKTLFKLQHIYLKKKTKHAAPAAPNVINTADGGFVILNVLGR